MDKIQKKRKPDIMREYQEKGYSADDLEKVLSFSQIKGTPEEVEGQIDTSTLRNWDKVLQLFESLKNRGVENVRANFGIVRGLDYYSGIVFEIFDDTSDLGALVGGGRYDTLTRAFGRDDMGATGAAGGVERIVHSLESQGISGPVPQGTEWVAYVSDEMKKVAISTASALRLKGMRAEVDLAGRPLRKQMEMASSSKYVILFAPKEFSESLVVVRNMSDGSEKKVKLDLVLDDPSSSLRF